jgi:sulfatase maturation enzyme AslB (radical SAM superfamily)
MEEEVALLAIDLLLAPRPPRARLGLNGGEPLLARPLARRCIEEARRRTPVCTTLEIGLTTNGTRLDDDIALFLARHDVALQVSFDGAGQELRAAGTRPAVESGLRRLAQLEPEWFGRRVRVALTLTPANLPLLSESIAAVAALGVPDIAITPARGVDWPPATEVEAVLDRQLGSIAASGDEYRRADGIHRVELFRAPSPRRLPDDEGPWCAAASPLGFAVDPDGIAWACPSFAGSTQLFPPAGEAVSSALRLGDVRDTAFHPNLADLPRRAAALPSLTRRRAKRSALAECGPCPLLAVCLHCPAAAAREPGPPDPDLVPAAACALTRAAARARDAIAPSLADLVTEVRRLTEELERLERLERSPN